MGSRRLNERWWFYEVGFCAGFRPRWARWGEVACDANTAQLTLLDAVNVLGAMHSPVV